LLAGTNLTSAYSVRRVSTEFSRFQPKFYIIIFTVVDAVSLLTQGAGVALAFWRSLGQLEAPGYSTYILLGGIAFQTLSMACFVIFSFEYGIRIYKKRRLFRQRAQYDVESAEIERLIRSKMVWCFWSALLISTILMFVRCVYRVFELSQGWSGPLNSNETMFVALESSYVFLTAISAGLYVLTLALL